MGRIAVADLFRRGVVNSPLQFVPVTDSYGVVVQDRSLLRFGVNQNSSVKDTT
jgi:hypothetical protein